MRIKIDFYKSGIICGPIYTFMQKGSGIRMHAHKIEQHFHNIVVLKGSVCVYGRDWQKIARAGELFDDFDSTKEHEICALEDNTKIINMFINGLPDRWEDMVASTEVETSLFYKIDDYDNPKPTLR